MALSINFKELLRQERERARASTNTCIAEKSPSIEAYSSKKRDIPSIKASEGVEADLSFILPNDWHESTLGNIPSLHYIPNAFSSDLQRNLLSFIDGHEWTNLKTRRLQCYGPSNDDVTTAALPGWLDKLIDGLVENHVFTSSHRPNHVLINRYEANQGIMHHTDGPRYHHRVAIISLESTCIMTFRRKLVAHEIGQVYDGDLFSVVLEPGSLLVFADDVYDNYMHGISEDAVQIIGSQETECLNMNDERGIILGSEVRLHTYVFTI
jgi:alkylated DNA repair protein alkB homolog 6